MPSSHSATVTALAAAIGLQEGFGGSLFATSLVLACVVRPLPFSFINIYWYITNVNENLLLVITFGSI